MLRYLDSSVVIDGSNPGGPRFSQIVAALNGLSMTEVCVSDLVRMESSIHAIRYADTSRIAALTSFFAQTTVLSMPREVFDLAAQLHAGEAKPRTPDALHLATALHHGCAEFWTNDVDLAKVPIALTFRTP